MQPHTHSAKQKLYNYTPEEREQIVNEINKSLGQHREIAFAYLYGSFIEDLPFHDIDIGIYLSEMPEQNTIYVLGLTSELSERLQLPVDVRLLNASPVPFMFHVLRGRLLTEQDPELRSAVTESVVARYLDMKPLLLRATKEAFSE